MDDKEHMRQLAYYVALRKTPVRSSPDLLAMASDDLWKWLDGLEIETLGAISIFLMENRQDPTFQADLLRLSEKDRWALAKVLDKLEPSQSAEFQQFLRDLPTTHPDLNPEIQPEPERNPELGSAGK